MTRTPLALAVALLGSPALAQTPAAPAQGQAQAAPAAAEPRAGEVRGELPPPRTIELPGKAPAPGAVLQEVTGTIRSVDRAGHRITVETAGGDVTLSLDRNTLVYGPRGLVTVLDLVPGAPVRAGRDGRMLAYWVTVTAPTPRAAEPPPPSGQGAHPGSDAGAPVEARPPVVTPPPDAAQAPAPPREGAAGEKAP